jgi:hypothetical protein
MVSNPPVSALITGVVSDPSRPASSDPSSPPPMPATYSAAVTRPRNSSGVTVCTIVPRSTTVIVSAAPATASDSSVSHKEAASAKTANEAPHTQTAASITSPCRHTCRSGPDSTAVASPPTPMAVVNSPSVRGSPPNRSALIAGNSDVGRPKNVAFKSARNVPARTGVRRMNETPAITAESRVRSGELLLPRTDGSRTAP